MPLHFLSNEQKGSSYAILSGLLYGLVGYFGMSIVKANLSISNMLFWRFLVTSLLMSLVIGIPFKTTREPLKEMGKVIFYGVAFYGTSSVLYFIASQYIGTGQAMVILFTYPAMVMFINYLLYKTQITKVYYLALLIILIGLMFLVDMYEFTFDIIGISLGILSALLYACYVIGSKKSTVSPLVSTLMVSIGCTITCLISSFIDQSFFIPVDFGVWVNICAIAIVCTAAPILLLLQSLKYITSEKASILSVLEPVFVVIFGIILLDEKITLTNAIGIIIVLSGALLTLLKGSALKNL